MVCNVFLSLLVVKVVCPSFCGPTEKANSPLPILPYSDYRKLFLDLGPNSSVSLVRFESDVFNIDARKKGKTTKERAYIPQTAIMLNKDGEPELFVKGTFFLVANVYGKKPKLGTVEQSIPLRSDAIRTKFRPLIEIFVGQDEQPMLMLGIWRKNTKGGLLDGEFIGPLTAADERLILNFKNTLDKIDLLKMNSMEAQRLLKSTNPLVVYLGLAKLEELDCISYRDFLVAIESLPAGYVESTGSYLLDRQLKISKGKHRDDFSRAFLHTFAAVDPGRKANMLKALNAFATRWKEIAGEVLDMDEMLRQLSRMRGVEMWHDRIQREFEIFAAIWMNEKK